MKRTIVGTKCPRSVEGSADTKSHKILLLLVVCVLALMASPAMYGQATGSFSGNVLDKSGSGVPGATVIATSQGTGLARDVKTDNAGHYLIPLLPVGTYTVRVDASGFQSAESKDLRLQVDEARELDFSLVPPTVVTTVAVSGDAVAVETANPSLGQVITSQQVSQLPLNGRDFVQLATLTAGATAETNPNSFFTSAASSEVAARGSFSLSVGGSRPNSTDWLLDGVDNNELTAGGISIFSSIDDIQEFKVLTYTYSAEYGTRAGPTVLVTTSPVPTTFTDLSSSLCAIPISMPKATLPAPVEKFNLNQFGGSVGGPIRKNKTLFLRRWRTEISAPRHSLYRSGAFAGHAQWRFLRRRLWQSRLRSRNRQPEHDWRIHKPGRLSKCLFPVRWRGESSTFQSRWKPGPGHSL